MPHKLTFRVLHASGQDEGYRASELNHHGPLTKGWQASRYCIYPQDIVLQLDHRSRLRKIQILSHQFLIATKIEIYVGDFPDDILQDQEDAKYTRLGYVSLSDNEKTGLKARELKSVHVDAVGQFVKLHIHKNHINKHNLYNQIGLVAVNIIGDEIRRPADVNELDLLDPDKKKALEDDPALEGLYNKPDYISPLDDLAFDMYQDPEVAGIIRKLEKKKQEAVLQERFDYAKRLRDAITELQKAGEKLGKYEVEKRQAIESEDYDKAKLKKIQMDEYRLQVYRDLNLADLLESSGSRHPQHIDLEPLQQPPTRLPELQYHSARSPAHTPPPKTPYDERPLPARKNKEPLPAPDGTGLQRTPYDERPLPVKPPPVPEEEESQQETASSGITGEPEPMSEKDLREASNPIDVFGLPLVSKAYSKTWSFREDALLAVSKEMQDLPASTSKEDAKSMMRASIFLIKRAIDDKVYAVFKAGIHLLRMILLEFITKHKFSKQEVVYTVEKTMPNLFHKGGDTATRFREDVKKFVLDEAVMPEVKPTNSVTHECVKPFKPNLAPRQAQTRCEILEMLYKKMGIHTNSGLTVDNLMQFCVVALSHNAGEVRDVSERIIKDLYKEDGVHVKDYLPPDTEKTRKITLYRQLYEYFDKVDGKVKKTGRGKSEEEKRKEAEIDMLQNQLQQLKDMASGKQDLTHSSNKPKNKKSKSKPVDESILNEQKKAPRKTSLSKGSALTNVSKKKTDNRKKQKDEDDVSVLNMDNICIFCGERNETFTEEGLDLHYWKHCPMLKRCTNCKQVVEIASYTEHLLGECEAKSNYAKCPRCSEAILKGEYDEHVAAKSCNPSKAGFNHCPLCHQNIGSGEDGWKNHLMGKDGCKQNPRRLLALNKPQQSKSRIPAKGKKTGR